MQTGIIYFIYKNELDKAQLNMAYGKSKNLTKRTESDKEIKHLKLQVIQNTMVIKED